MVKVSIVVPVCNVEKYLRQCLDSIAAQTLKDIEVIIVNDGSKDSSGAICDEYVAKDPRFSVIHKPNSGYGSSMNIGFTACTGEYIGIIESDDYADEEMFEDLYDTAVKNDADVVKSNFYFYYSAVEEKNEFGEVIPFKLCGKVFRPTTDLKGMEEVRFWNAKPSIWSSIYKRSFIEDIIRKNNAGEAIMNGCVIKSQAGERVIEKTKVIFNETPGASYQDASFSFKIWACAQRAFCLYAAYLHYRQDNANSSVNNPGKVYCVCDEYDEMTRFINENKELEHLFPLMNRMRFDSYMWNMSRIAEEFVPDFAKKTAEDFREAAAAKRINKLQFEPWKWEQLTKVASMPADFARDYIIERRNEPLTKQLTKMQTSLNKELQKNAEISAQPKGLFARLCKKARTFLFILRHEGVSGVKRAIKEKLN